MKEVKNDMRKKQNDSFVLYDLRIEVSKKSGTLVCNHKVGDYFELSGENLSIPAGKVFSVYALSALLPLLPAKQRETHPNDWMTTDTEIACPDPNCKAIFEIKRTRKKTFHHGDVTITPLKEKK